MGRELPDLLSMDKGVLGKFLKVENLSAGVVNVYYIPRGFFNALFNKIKVLRNVPESAVKELPPSPSNDKDDGVAKGGIVVVLTGEYGQEPWLAKQIEMSYVGDVARLEEEKKLARIEKGHLISTIRKLERGHEERLKELKKSMDIISKPEKKERKSPFDNIPHFE